ncbi:hypothetical protein ACWKW6_12835 [Dyadobacter jiangsuensis]
MKKPTVSDLRKINPRAIAAVFVIGFFLFIGVDLFSGKTIQHAGTIVNKVYIPERTYVQTHTRQNARGRTEFYTTWEHDPARWLLYVESLDGKVMAVDCRPELFYTKQNGQVIPYLVTYGRFTGIPYFPRATNQPTHNYETESTNNPGQTQTY